MKWILSCFIKDVNAVYPWRVHWERVKCSSNCIKSTVSSRLEPGARITGAQNVGSSLTTQRSKQDYKDVEWKSDGDLLANLVRSLTAAFWTFEKVNKLGVVGDFLWLFCWIWNIHCLVSELHKTLMFFVCFFLPTRLGVWKWHVRSLVVLNVLIGFGINKWLC